MHPDTRDEDIDLEYMVDNVWVVGSPDEVAERLAGLYDDIGGFGTLVVWSHEWEPRDSATDGGLSRSGYGCWPSSSTGRGPTASQTPVSGS